MKKQNVALIGCGRISYKHIEALLDNREIAELVAVCDVDEKKAHERAKQYIEKNDLCADVKTYSDYKKMIETEMIDIVVVATESGYHYEQSMYALKNDKHVLVEKPIALSTKHAQEMIDLADQRKLKLGVCHQNRFNPPIQYLRRAIQDGRFGKIVNVTARILWNRNMEYYNQAPWRGTKLMDGGTLMNQCIHNIDLLQWMMNCNPISISAQTDTFLRTIEMEDFGAMIIRFENNSIGIVEGSACVYPKNLEETLSIFGEKGTVVIGGLAVNEMKVWQFEDDKDYDREVFESTDDIANVYGNGHSLLYKDFIDSVNNDLQPLVSGVEGMKAMEIILASYKSSKNNTVVKFPLGNYSTMD